MKVATKDGGFDTLEITSWAKAECSIHVTINGGLDGEQSASHFAVLSLITVL